MKQLLSVVLFVACFGVGLGFESASADTQYTNVSFGKTYMSVYEYECLVANHVESYCYTKVWGSTDTYVGLGQYVYLRIRPTVYEWTCSYGNPSPCYGFAWAHKSWDPSLTGYWSLYGHVDRTEGQYHGETFDLGNDHKCVIGTTVHTSDLQWGYWYYSSDGFSGGGFGSCPQA